MYIHRKQKREQLRRNCAKNQYSKRGHLYVSVIGWIGIYGKEVDPTCVFGCAGLL